MRYFRFIVERRLQPCRRKGCSVEPIVTRLTCCGMSSAPAVSVALESVKRNELDRLGRGWVVVEKSLQRVTLQQYERIVSGAIEEVIG